MVNDLRRFSRGENIRPRGPSKAFELPYPHRYNRPAARLLRNHVPGYTQHDGARACPSCGAENTEGTKFCHECGGAMEAEAAPAADPLLGQTILDRYKIVSELGEGGMGKVYRAEQKMGNATRFVAIKTLHPELSRDPQIVARFLRESETVIQLTHPNTIQFYDFGELPDKTLFIVMEYIEGESLAHTLLRGAIEPTRVDKLLVQICGSLNEAHGLGIVHRDLKPDNILLTNRGGQTDFVKVLDFGIAKRSEAEDQKDAKLTKQGMVLGTPPYMSPEQFSGVALDARSDIYSLGLITYEMLTGELPFMARTPWEWATQHLTVQPTPLDRHPVAELLPPHKRAAVMRALEKDRSNRQPSVLDFMREFTGATDAQAAWAAVTSAAGAATTSTSDPNSRTPTGAVVRKAVGTPEAMPQTNELDFAEAGLLARSSGAGSRAAVIIGLCAAVGAVAGAAWFFPRRQVERRCRGANAGKRQHTDRHERNRNDHRALNALRTHHGNGRRHERRRNEIGRQHGGEHEGKFEIVIRVVEEEVGVSDHGYGHLDR
ncbi:MAG: serine/threonine-protein kinase [Polyangiales bacterium]